MATGDVRAAVAALQTALRSVKLADDFDTAAAEAGSPAPLLPALDYVLLRFSKHVALLVAERGLQLNGLSDLRFLEGVFKFARDVLGMRLALTPAQFLSEGYAERKVQLVRCVVKACREVHNTAARKERLAALRGHHTERLYGHVEQRPRERTQQPVAQEGRQPGQGGACSMSAPPTKHTPVGPSPQPAAADAGRAACDAPAEHCAAELRPDASSAPLDQPRPLPSPLAAAAHAAASAVGGGSSWSVCSPAGSTAADRGCAPTLTETSANHTAPLQDVQQPAAAATQQQQSAPPSAGAVQQALPEQSEQGAKPDLSPPERQQQSAGVGLVACAVAAPAKDTCAMTLQEPQPDGVVQQHCPSAQPRPELLAGVRLQLESMREAAAAARQEAEQVQQHLRARLIVLEGRVRCLEAACEPHLVANPLRLQPTAKPAGLLPGPGWAVPAFGSGRGVGTAFPAAMPAKPEGRAAPLAAWAPPAAGYPAEHAVFNRLAQQMGSLSGLLHGRAGAPGCPGALLAATPLRGSNGAAAAPSADRLQAAEVAAASLGTPPPPVPAAEAVQLPGVGGTTAELIAGMQARFSEAQQFLLKVQLR